MKLNKNLILTSMLAISVFISSTSYASNEENINIEINQAALDEMANKVDKNTIFTEVDTVLSQNGENDKTQEDKKTTEEKPKDKNKSENPQSTENSNVIVKPQTEEDKETNESENQDETDTSEDDKDDKNDKNDKEVLEDKEKSDQIDKDNESNNNPIDENEIPENQDSSSDKILEEENKSKSPNVESMQRLENIHKDEKVKNMTYAPRANSNGQTLQKLTSKESLTTSFKDKGSNLRLNLANVEDYENSTGKKDSQFIIKPQTIIILIAILAAIFSALYIAIRGKNKKNKNL